MNKRLLHRVAMACAFLVVCLPSFLGCSLWKKPPPIVNQAKVDYDLLLTLPAEPISFEKDVQPVLERRCVVCHGCYDAPCQLKLSSFAGLDRGTNVEKVYDSARIEPMDPTRLFVDAKNTAEWRTKGFHSVLNEDGGDTRANLENSVMYQILRLKQLHPQPRVGMLPEDFDLGLDRDQTCASIDDFQEFADDHPLWGMPYAMPNLDDDEYRVLTQWIAQGAPPPEEKAPSAGVALQILGWEEFLNQKSNKHRLMSRYIYEHLFLGHIHLEGTSDREFYRLIRSRTPPEWPAEEIPTVRSDDSPGPEFYYRLVPYTPSIVAKTHLVYEFSDERLDRYHELFLEPEYDVPELPSYAADISNNPLKAFAAIPPLSRFRFLLDDARFFVGGLIKGPVCRGQVAVDVIDDQFWIVFLSPDKDIFIDDPKFLDKAANYLRLPAERKSNLRISSVWSEYWKGQKEYLKTKDAYFSKIRARGIDEALEFIWDGDGTNPNAALTVFRHFDGASVEYGLLGDYPKTAWVLDYSTFERIHYLLVTGFNVYGNVGHQLETRLYMDFLRMEAEDNFLLFLPADRRKAIRDDWYDEVASEHQGLFEEPMDWLGVEAVTGYRTDDPLNELFGHIERRLASSVGPSRDLNRPQSPTVLPRSEIDDAMRELGKMQGDHLKIFPDVAFVRVEGTTRSQADSAYTIVLNKGYKNLTSMLENEDRRDPSDDTLTIIPGLVGAYPNFFFHVRSEDVHEFVEHCAAVRERDDYERLVGRYGIRRTNPKFWELADWFQEESRRTDLREAGIYDLNRYRNR